jgi:hypothetical protein
MIPNLRPWRLKYDGAVREWDYFHDDRLGAPDGIAPPTDDNDIAYDDADVAGFKERSLPCFTHSDWEKLSAVATHDMPASGDTLMALDPPVPGPHTGLVTAPWVQPPTVNSLREQRMGHVWARQGPVPADRLSLVRGMSSLGMAVMTIGGRRQTSEVDDAAVTRADAGLRTTEDDERLSAFLATLGNVGKALMAETSAGSSRAGTTLSLSLTSDTKQVAGTKSGEVLPAPPRLPESSAWLFHPDNHKKFWAVHADGCMWRICDGQVMGRTSW